VYKLQHFHTGKILKSYVHVDKLQPCSSARAARRKRRQIATIDRVRDTAIDNEKPPSGGNGSRRKRDRADVARKRTMTHLRNANRRNHETSNKSADTKPHTSKATIQHETHHCRTPRGPRQTSSTMSILETAVRRSEQLPGPATDHLPDRRPRMPLEWGRQTLPLPGQEAAR